MSRLYDTIEPSVIDEQMLKDAVEDQGPKGEAGRIAKQEGIDFDTVLALRLDYRSKVRFNKFTCRGLEKVNSPLFYAFKVEGTTPLRIYINNTIKFYNYLL